MADQTPVADTRSRAEIEADLAAARERLAQNLAALIGEVHPKAVARHTVEDARQFVDSGFQQLKDQFVDERGLRVRRVALVAAAVAGAATFAVIVRSIVRGR